MARQVGRRQQAPINVPASAATPAFVGREDSLATMTDALGHRPALVLVEGEPGIGKTRLVREALTVVPDLTVLHIACPPLREPFPLGPVVDGVRRLWDQVGGSELSALGGVLRPLFPEWADRLPPPVEPLDDPKETRHRILRALTELVQRLNVGVLVVEDAHWSDSPTLEWLLTLTSAADHGMCIVTTYRPSDVPENSLLLGLTSRLPGGMTQVRVVLGPLDVAATRRLVASMFGTEEVSEEFGAFLHERTDGIPLAVEETVRLLRTRHDIVRHDGRWTRRLLDELEVPPTVRDSVLERLARMPRAARQMLDAAAVLGEPADESLLSVVAGLDESQAERGVAAALTSGILREAKPGRFMFRHALDAQAVDEAIPASRRRRLHGRAADALRTIEPAPVVRLARYCREAGDTEGWCRYGEASADLALESGDDHAAVTMLYELLTSLDHAPDRRVRLARKLGEAAFFGTAAIGEVAEHVVAALRGVLERVDAPPGERGELRLLLGRMLWAVGQEPASFVEIETAMPDLDHRPELAFRAMCNLALPLIPDWPAQRHLHWLDRATELLPHLDSAEQRMFTMNRATVLLLLGANAAWQSVAEIDHSASDSREQRHVARRLLNVAWAMLPWGRYEEMRRQLDVADELVQATEYRRLVTDVQLARAYLDWYCGRWDGLDAAAAELAATEGAELHGRLQARQIQGLIELATGARGAAGLHLREASAQYLDLGVTEPASVGAPAGLGRLYLADGAVEAALQVTAPVVEIVARKGVWFWAADLAPVHVDALVGDGRLATARTFVADFAEGIAGRDAAAAAAALLVCHGILAAADGDLGEAAARFGDAAGAWVALPRPYDELLARERQGTCLVAAEEPDQGIAVLTDTQERLRGLGARWDADRVARLLREHGVEVSRAWKSGPQGYGDQLSPREREVLALVAQGMTNRQVAEVLFLSPRTVGRHLSTAMRKLGVSTRTAAAMAAAEAGLIESDGHVPGP